MVCGCVNLNAFCKRFASYESIRLRPPSNCEFEGRNRNRLHVDRGEIRAISASQLPRTNCRVLVAGIPVALIDDSPFPPVAVKLSPPWDRKRPILLKNSVAAFAASPRRKSTSQIDLSDRRSRPAEGFDHPRKFAQEGTTRAFQQNRPTVAGRTSAAKGPVLNYKESQRSTAYAVKAAARHNHERAAGPVGVSASLPRLP